MSMWRASYATVVGLAYQSYRFELDMNRELLEMANAAIKATTLESESASDLALSTENSELSAADELESESMHERATQLEIESKRDFAAAEAARASSAELAAEATEKEVQAEAQDSLAAVEEVMYEADKEKATAEGAEAVKLQVEIEGDGATVATCEFIPFLDVVCDTIGGVSALAMEASAAKWSAKSAFDVTAAAAAKEQENTNLAASAKLHTQAGEDSEKAVDFENEATEKQATAEEEAAAAKKEELQAEAKMTKSKEEQALSIEESAKADSEQVESSQWWEKFILHGITAYWNAILSGVLSLMAFLSFFVRTFVEVIFPSVAEMVTLPLTTALPNRRPSQNLDELAPSAWGTLRQLSYFILHCGTFFTGIVTFSKNIESMEKLDNRSKCGVVLSFALFVASIQSISLHVLPKYKHIKREDSLVARSCMRTIWRSSCLFGCAFIHLVPMIIMETLSLVVIFGYDLFNLNLSEIEVSFVVLGFLFCVLVHVYFFEIDEGCTENIGNLSAVPHCDLPFDSHSIVDNNGSLGNEREPLLSFATESGEEERIKISSSGYHSTVDDGSCKERGLSEVTISSEELEQTSSILSEEREETILQKVFSTIKQYFSEFQFSFELLVMCCMFALVKSSIPTFLRLWPMFWKKFQGSFKGWLRIGVAVGFTAIAAITFWYLHRSSETKPSNRRAGLFTGESIRAKTRTILSFR